VLVISAPLRAENELSAEHFERFVLRMAPLPANQETKGAEEPKTQRAERLKNWNDWNGFLRTMTWNLENMVVSSL
jgi:hypothetical protein